jgi:hypothetical protein
MVGNGLREAEVLGRWMVKGESRFFVIVPCML